MGVGAIVGGIALATTRNDGRHLTRRDLWIGLAAGVSAVLLSAGGIIIMKPLMQQSPLIWLSEVRLAGGIVTLGGILLVHPRRRAVLMSLRSPRGFRFTVIGSFIGAYLALLPWAAGFKFGQASITSALQQTANLFVFILGIIFLKEPLTLFRGLGMILGIAGIYLVTFG